MQYTVYPKVKLKKGRELSDSRMHPWIFSGAIQFKDKSINSGDLVSVFSFNDEFIGIGTYSPSSISVRILSRLDIILDINFWYNKLKSAKELREHLEINSDSYRLVHGEGDFVSGLIIDKYANLFVIQAHDEGIFKMLDQIKSALVELYGKDIIVYNKSKKSLPFLENIEESFIYGDSVDFIKITENNLFFNVDVVNGQKTGFFIDQRDNRNLVKKFANNKKCLNTFCYTGGFSVYSLSGGASMCTSVDSSELAIEATIKNIELNGFSEKHQALKSDVFKFFENNTEKFDLIVVDPPAFAKHQKARKQALNAYTRINKMAIDSLSDDGFLFTFSCSQAISEEDFQRAIFNAVLQTNRSCQIISKLGQPKDHPLDIYHPEGKYLKGFMLKIS